MTDKNDQNRLSGAYHHMLTSIRHSVQNAEGNFSSALDHAFESARRNFTELGQLTRDEAQLLSEYIRRDTHDIAHRMSESREEIRSWLHMDVELIEASLLDNLLHVADQTRVALTELSVNAQRNSAYQSGEITGPGVLICRECGNRIEFIKPDSISACSMCGGTVFRRPDSDT